MKRDRAVRNPAPNLTTGAADTTRIRPAVALGLLALAFLAWMGALAWNRSGSEAQRHVEAGNEFAQKGQNVDAVTQWEIAVKMDPDNADVQQLLGQSYYAAGTWRRAIERLLQVHRLRPATPHIDAMLANCFLNIGDAASALRYGEAALKVDPNDLLALETCSTAQTRLGDALEERRFLERLVAKEPPNVTHLLALAELVMNARDFAKCHALADRALQQNTDNAEAHAMRGISAFFVDGSPDGMKRAESDLELGLQFVPEAYYCHLYLGRIYHRLANFPQALQHLKEAIRLAPDKADAYYDLASVYQRTGQNSLADAARKRFESLAQDTETKLHRKKQLEVKAAVPQATNYSAPGGS